MGLGTPSSASQAVHWVHPLSADSGRGLGGHPLSGTRKTGGGSSSSPPRIKAHLDLGEQQGHNLVMQRGAAGGSGAKDRGSRFQEIWIWVLALPLIRRSFV